MRAAWDLWRILRSDNSALVGAVIIGVYLVLAIFGPMFTHVDMTSRPDQAYLSPSWHHLLGTDAVGVDVAGQLILGFRPILAVGILAAVFTCAVGVFVGLAIGYIGGVVDTVVMRIVDIFLTVPSLPLLIVLASFIESSSPFVLAALLSITGWAGLARPVRAQALSLREVDFTEAARIQGLPLRHIVSRQLLPNVGPWVAIHFLLAITGAIYAEVGLFLLGVAPISGTNWGVMINLAQSQGALYTKQSMLYLFSPMALIVILQMAFVFFSRALDQFFNPRLRVR